MSNRLLIDSALDSVIVNVIGEPSFTGFGVANKETWIGGTSSSVIVNILVHRRIGVA